MNPVPPGGQNREGEANELLEGAAENRVGGNAEGNGGVADGFEPTQRTQGTQTWLG